MSTEEVSNTVFLSHLYTETIIMPRQAPDKHRENSKKDRVSLGYIPVNLASCQREFDWTQIIALNLYLTAAPTGAAAAAAPVILVSELLARKELSGVIGGGSIQIGDSLALTLPAGVLHGSGCTNRTLACNIPPCNVSGCADYVEFEESSNVSRFFDANGFELRPSTMGSRGSTLQTSIQEDLLPAVVDLDSDETTTAFQEHNYAAARLGTSGGIAVRVKLSSSGGQQQDEAMSNVEITLVEKSSQILGPFLKKAKAGQKP